MPRSPRCAVTFGRTPLQKGVRPYGRRHDATGQGRRRPSIATASRDPDGRHNEQTNSLNLNNAPRNESDAVSGRCGAHHPAIVVRHPVEGQLRQGRSIRKRQGCVGRSCDVLRMSEVGPRQRLERQLDVLQPMAGHPVLDLADLIRVHPSQSVVRTPAQPAAGRAVGVLNPCSSTFIRGSKLRRLDPSDPVPRGRPGHRPPDRRSPLTPARDCLLASQLAKPPVP